jgi:hypothetical protein
MMNETKHLLQPVLFFFFSRSHYEQYHPTAHILNYNPYESNMEEELEEVKYRIRKAEAALEQAQRDGDRELQLERDRRLNFCWRKRSD